MSNVAVDQTDFGATDFGADAAWFKNWEKNKKDRFLALLEKALWKIEDSGINLGEVFSLHS